MSVQYFKALTIRVIVLGRIVFIADQQGDLLWKSCPAVTLVRYKKVEWSLDHKSFCHGLALLLNNDLRGNELCWHTTASR